MDNFKRARTKAGVPGLNGTGLLEAEKTDIFNRLTEAESDISDANDRMDTFPAFDLTGIAAGDLLKYDGTKLVKYTPAPIVVPILISAAAGSESSDPTVGRQAIVDFNFTATITGWSVKNRTAGSVEWDLLVGGVSITGTAKPKTTSALDRGSTTLTGWTTTIASGTPLEIYINSASGTNISAFNLHLTRNLTWGD